MHSTVFHDMFMMPLPPDEPLVDNCPVVVLSGDSVEDWMHLLAAMFPTSYFREPQAEILVVAALLRLAKKYDIPVLRKEFLSRLKHEFPTTLLEFDEVEGWQHISPGHSANHTLVALINLAREMGLYSILPTMFYSLNLADTEDEAFRLLSLSDQIACFKGYAGLLKLHDATTMLWLKPPSGESASEDCSQVEKCRSALKSTAYHIFLGSKDNECVLDSWDERWGRGLCDDCQVVQQIFREGRRECWRKLPSVFGLPDWEELIKLDF
ncbi:hypothetical protein C8F01DRAFT_1115117, partial [Mycena amicta]